MVKYYSANSTGLLGSKIGGGSKDLSKLANDKVSCKKCKR